MRWHGLRNTVLGFRRESLLKVVVVSGLGAGFWFALFFLFNESFEFLNQHALVFREVLIQRVFSLFFLTLLFMLIFSNALISFSNLFRSPETSFLFSLPLRHETIYLYKLAEALVFSSWAFLALGLPLLLAYGIQSQVHLVFFPGLLIFLVPFVVLPAAVGSLLGLLLTAWAPRQRGKVLGILGGLCLVVGLFWAVKNLISGSSPNGMWGSYDLRADVQMILGRLNFTQHPLSPNLWMTRGLMALAEGERPDFLGAGLSLAALGSSALFFLVLGWFLGARFYPSTFSNAQVSNPIRRAGAFGWLEWLAGPFKRKWPEVTVLVLKDVKTFFREPVQWLQVLIFFGLLAAYIANLRNFSYPLDKPFYQNLISHLNLGATCLTLATLISRFVFPLISLEGKRFWILGLAPISRTKVLLSKFLFSFGGALLVTQSLVLLSHWILEGAPLMWGVHALTGAFLCLGLTGLGVGMGALFPNLRETNPSKIVAGFGGTLTLILSISLVLLSVALEGFICHYYLVVRQAGRGEQGLGDEFAKVLWLVVAGVVLLNLLAAWIPLHLGVRAFRKMDF